MVTEALASFLMRMHKATTVSRGNGQRCRSRRKSSSSHGRDRSLKTAEPAATSMTDRQDPDVYFPLATLLGGQTDGKTYLRLPFQGYYGSGLEHGIHRGKNGDVPRHQDRSKGYPVRHAIHTLGRRRNENQRGSLDVQRIWQRNQHVTSAIQSATTAGRRSI